MSIGKHKTNCTCHKEDTLQGSQKKHPMHIAAAHSSRGARTVEVPWQKLESVLTGGVRGPKLSRWFYKGPKKLFLIPRRGLKKFLKGQLSTRLQKLPSFAKSRSNRHGENVATYLVPLTGNPTDPTRCAHWNLTLGKERAPSYLSSPCSALLTGSEKYRFVIKRVQLLLTSWGKHEAIIKVPLIVDDPLTSQCLALWK